MRQIPDFALIFASTLCVNLSAFAVLILSSRALSIPDFAELSKAMGIIAVGAALLDAGLNTTATKFHAAAENMTAVDAMVFTKTILLICMIPGIALAALGVISPFWAICAIAAASTNLWGGWRARDIARMDCATLWTNSAKLTLARIILSIPAVYSGSWLAVCVTLWIAPVAILAPWRNAVYSLPQALPAIRAMAGYAAKVHLSSVAFCALIFAPQIFINARLGSAEVATFGLVIIVIGPLSLAGASLRAYLLPRVASSRFEGSLPTRRLLTIGALAALCGLSLATYLLSWLYGSLLPEIGPVFAVTASSHLATVLIGLHNTKVHRFGIPHVELYVNVARLIVSLAAMAAFGGSLISIAVISGAVLVAGELWLAWMVRRASR